MDVSLAAATGKRGEAQATSAASFGTLVDLMMTVSYVDGAFHPREREYVQRYMDSILLMIEQGGGSRAQWSRYFEELYPRIDAEVALMARDDAAALRKRAVGLLQELSLSDRGIALELIAGLINADGAISPAEHAMQQELTAYAQTQRAFGPNARTLVGKQQSPIVVEAAIWKELTGVSSPLLDPIEMTLSPHPVERQAQIEWDFRLVQQAIVQWNRQRQTGNGRLAGIDNVNQLPAGTRFLDSFVHIMRPSAPVELVVLGDLHGCYSCLKAALLQSNFVERAWAHQWDPANYPDVKLVLLGDYIDRGRFSFDGVLRAALHLFVSMPDHVILLRGNHEWLRWWDGNRIASAVYPAEGLASIAPYVTLEHLEGYRQMFEHMPTSLLCDRLLFVHGGIPRDDTFAERYRDLSSLNDPEIRFQMMWSDPVQTDRVPVEMQRLNPRFEFGRAQFVDFMKRTGMGTMIRGHEQIDSGFEVCYDLGEHVLLDLFSAGGHDNADLPIDSSYRTIRPMGLTIRIEPGKTPVATPWPLHYQPFNYAPHNGLYRPQPVLEYRYL